MKKLVYIVTMILVFAANTNEAFSATKETKSEKPTIKTVKVKGRIDFDMYGNVFAMKGANVQLHHDKLGTFPKEGSFITAKDGQFIIEVPADTNYNLYVNNRFVATTQTLSTNTILQPYIGGRSKMQTVTNRTKRVTIFAAPRATM